MRRRTGITTTTTPVAVIGTIALSLTGAPAHAETPVTAEPHPLRALPQPSTAVASPTVDTRKRTKTHTVVNGDTVSAVAARHGLRTADVLAWNGLTWKSIIHPGDVLTLSAGADKPSVKKTAKSTSTKVSTTRSAATHTVTKGDTLWSIARSAGVSLASLLRSNDLTASSIIYPGEKLTIPGSSGPAQAATSTKKKAKASAKSSAKSAPAASAEVVRLDAEQIRGVKTIIAVGRDLGVPDKGIAIALATAMVESWIRNVDYGTHDSLGLFQQRPSMGWGTIDQVQDPRRATRVFFGGPGDPNGSATRGLLDIGGWRDMDFGAAAQAVQVSAYPDRYGRWEKQAYAWIKAHG